MNTENQLRHRPRNKGRCLDAREGTMRLVLTDDDGTVLDITKITPEEWRKAERNPEVAQMHLMSLTPGDDVLKGLRTPPQNYGRCMMLAKKGTGYGVCDLPLNDRGYCDGGRDHIE